MLAKYLLHVPVFAKLCLKADPTFCSVAQILGFRDWSRCLPSSLVSSQPWACKVSDTGADVGTSCSYQATFAGFEKAGFSKDEAESLFKRSIDLCTAARDAFWASHKDKVNHLGIPNQSLCIVRDILPDWNIWGCEKNDNATASNIWPAAGRNLNLLSLSTACLLCPWKKRRYFAGTCKGRLFKR